MQNKKATALIFFIVLTFVLGILAATLVKILRYQTRYTVLSLKKTQAFYIAEAGLQHKMNELLRGNTDYLTLTAFDGGWYEVSVNDENPYYILFSTGYYGKDISKPKAITKLKALVKLKLGGATLRVGQKIDFQNAVHIYGDIYSNEQVSFQNEVHFYAKEKQTGSIYVSQDIANAVSFQNEVYFESGNQYIKTRGNSANGELPYEHAPLSNDDPTSGVYDEGEIQTPQNVTIVERDNSEDTDPFELIPMFDISSLIADVTYDTHKTFDSANPLNLNDKTHLFRGGIKLQSEDALAGEGTIWVDGTGDALGNTIGVDFRADIGTITDYKRINVIVTGGTWDYDIWFQNNTFVEGYIYAENNIHAQNEFRLKGAIEIKNGNGSFQNPVYLEYSDLIGFLPVEGGSTILSVKYVSFEEITPAK
ncbi:MAG: hypothetical protein J7L42_03630 [Elusimicrobia bacterium]|nr:hypothetical protein [Elusimicrobiota bacterium]